MTDGQSTIERDLTVSTARAAHDLGIRTFAIGVGSADYPEFKDEIEGIASDPDDDHVFSLTDFGDLQFIEETLVRRTCRE
ncbi:VWA domain-containing protein, partial [Clostridium perfringens]|nr:VWA domain-containing protein [Clostridium perfringens]